MTVLSAPTRYNESNWSNRWCAQSVIADWATDWLQRVVLPPEVDAQIPAKYKGAFGTTIEGAVVGARAFGLPVSDPIYGVPMSSYWAPANDNLHRVMVLHQCNPYAVPVPTGSSTIAHFRDGYGIDSVNTATMNPFGGTLDTIGIGKMFAADLKQHIEFLGVMPRDRQDLVLVAITGELPVAPASINDLDDSTLWGVVMDEHLKLTGEAMANPVDVRNEMDGIRRNGFTDPVTGAHYPAGWAGYVTYLQNLPAAKALRARRGW